MYVVNVTKHPLYTILLLTRRGLSFDSPENKYTRTVFESKINYRNVLKKKQRKKLFLENVS